VEIRDLTGNDLRLVIAGVEVPAGRYAHQAFCDWAGNDSDALAAIGENVVSEEVDVRGVMAKVQFGEADAGVVYASDAAASELAGVPLNVIEFPEDIWTLASYPIAPVTGGDHDAAQAFISFVLSEDGQNILERYGFRQPS
jgi:molybdate transport system substrate-binding protein